MPMNVAWIEMESEVPWYSFSPFGFLFLLLFLIYRCGGRGKRKADPGPAAYCSVCGVEFRGANRMVELMDHRAVHEERER